VAGLHRPGNSSVLPRLDLPADWIFTTDPEDKGVSEKWYANQKFYDAVLPKKPMSFGGAMRHLRGITPDSHQSGGWLGTAGISRVCRLRLVFPEYRNTG